MNGCGCRWDGNLDGRLIRCTEHARQRKAEIRARKLAAQTYRELIEESHR